MHTDDEILEAGEESFTTQSISDTTSLIISADELEMLKAKYKRLYVIDICFDEDEKYQFIARRPNRQTIDAIVSNKGNTSKMMDILIKNMIVAGDINAIEDGIVYSRVLEALTSIIKEGKKLFTRA